MNKYFYPALFHKAEEGGFWITFPDFPECMTQGDDMEESYNMAVDALGLSLTDMEKNHIPFPTPTPPDKITMESDTVLVLIEFDMLAYKKRTNSAAVKKTLTIPQWLNEEALALNVNFSQVLQEALVDLIQKQKA
ncbi:MAG: type II toxin-antitoxin system HicB family antitoxin [Lachnospiraceae bacterium]|nr:type II toxin-antitoxin system HicB family antitoxin [Lachnospiraceae bacterium]